MKPRHSAAAAALAMGGVISVGKRVRGLQPAPQGARGRWIPSVVPAGIVSGSDRTNDRRCQRTRYGSARGGGHGAAAVPSNAVPASAGVETPPCRHSPLCGNRQGRSPVVTARSVETDDGAHVHVPVRVASGLAGFPWLPSIRRETSVFQGPRASRSCSSLIPITS